MPRVKICAPIFQGGVRIHNTGDTPEVSDANAKTYTRRGWAETYKAPPPAPSGDDEKKGSKGGKDK